MNKFSLPQGAQAGAAGVAYRLWAPQCHAVAVHLFGPEGEVRRTLPMRREPGDFFTVTDVEGQAGDLYKYALDSGAVYPDPASRFQPQGVHGPSMVIDPAAYRWRDEGWTPPAFRDLVIYELHVGTFTPEGTYRSAIARLAHVRALGANAIELMPLADFAGERGWGYDGVSWFAPTRAYGTPDELRMLVDAAHEAGLAVILDVVYNHFGPAGNYLHAYIGEYLDESAKTPWGGAIRYGDPAFHPLREFTHANPVYWRREFHVDGFRLDATHAIFDESPQHLLAELAEAIHREGAFLIAEDPRNDARLLAPVADGGMGFDGVWADDFHHTVRVANTRENESYLGDFSGKLEELVETLRHGWYYRGQVSPRRGKPRGSEVGQLVPEKFIHCISNHDQTGNHPLGRRLNQLISPAAYRATSALLCLTPGTPMLFMGQEWAAGTPFQFFTDHEPELGHLITEGRREEFAGFAAFNDPAMREHLPDPQAATTFAASRLRWEELEQPQAREMLALYQAALALRAAQEVFRPDQRDSWEVQALAGGAGMVRYHGEAADWLLVFDLVGGHQAELPVAAEGTAPAEGRWQVVFSSNEARFGGTEPGERHVHGEVAFATPGLLVLREERAEQDGGQATEGAVTKVAASCH